MPHAALVIVGSEMLDPGRSDANGPLARQALAELGIPLRLVARVEDSVESIREAFRAAAATCEIVVASGGLGPTGDDLTREGLASLLGRGIHEDETWFEVLAARLRERSRPLTELGRRQALLVDGGEALPNGAGLACGNWVEAGGTLFALLPGVPREFQDIFQGQVIPRLAGRYPEHPEVRTVKAIVAGIPEVEAEAVLRPWYDREGVAVSILPSYGVLKITFTLFSPPAADLESLQGEARASLEGGLGEHLVSLDGLGLEERIGELLLSKGWTLATAESCTAGLASHKIVSAAGASGYFLGGITAYDNSAKVDLLGVSPETLEAHGAVSEETALAMVRGARARFVASCALSTTGVAGPSGGTPEKPVGTVWVAAGTPLEEKARCIRFPADRATVREIGANYALHLLWTLLKRP